jgi:hypothetical protein
MSVRRKGWANAPGHDGNAIKVDANASFPMIKRSSFVEYSMRLKNNLRSAKNNVL